MMNEHEPAYLGDGVYAAFDGMHVILATRGRDDLVNSNQIFLDQTVWQALVDYGDRVFERTAEETKYGNCSVCGLSIYDGSQPHRDYEHRYCHASCCPVCHEGEPPYEDAGDPLEHNSIADWGDQ